VLLDVSSWPWLWKTSSILTYFGWSCWMIEPNLPLDFRCIVPSSCFQRLGFTANTANTHSPANMFTQLAPEAASPKATRRQIEIDCCSSCLSKHAYIFIVFICFPLLSHIFLDWLNRKRQVGHWVSQTKMKPPANKCRYIHVMHQSKLCCFRKTLHNIALGAPKHAMNSRCFFWHLCNILNFN
jgi:hypothetical protein